jgi:SOS-response transcriptional repressor LexA
MREIEKLMELFGVTKDVELAEKLELKGSGTISTWKKRGHVPQSTLRKCSKKFGLPLEWFTDETIPYVMKKVFNRICCGDGIEPEGYEMIAEVMVPEKYDKPNIIMVKAKGNSMEPTICEGAYVAVDTNDKDIVSGKMYAVCSDLEGSIIKRIVIEGDKLFLVPDNNVWKGVEITEIPDYFVIGRVRLVVNEY